MVVLPYSHLFLSSELAIVTLGPHVQVLDALTGFLHFSTDTPRGAFSESDKRKVLKSGTVQCAAVCERQNDGAGNAKAGLTLATCGEDKILRIFEVEIESAKNDSERSVNVKILNEREVPKRPTAIRFTKSGQTILVSDKFGDVFSYSLHPRPAESRPKPDPRLLSHENPSDGDLVLGHTSLLTTFLLTEDERYIITADRDEHIRVSWFPRGYEIEMFCLGHTKFVSAIHCPTFQPSELISGGGDPELRIWDWLSGTPKHDIQIWDAVRPFVKVSRSSIRKSHDEGDETTAGRRNRRGKKKKGARHAEGQDAGGATAGPSEETREAAREGDAAKKEDDLVLVVHKIDTLSTGSVRYIVFSAVGATALFITRYPDDASSLDVSAFDLTQPILDFVTKDGLIWVTVDVNWPESSGGDKAKSAYVLRIKEDGQLAETGGESPLLTSLCETATIAATEDDLKSLNLYDGIASLPKGTEHEAPEDQIIDEDDPRWQEIGERQRGRQKKKKAVLAKMQEKNGEEPEVKKVRPTREEGDVEMT